MNPDPKTPVSLEDLLHLKRSERPPEQFWVQFESELRAKQLAAIVQRRPWWHSWEGISRVLTRQSLPIGATAALAVGLVSFREYRAHSSRGVMAVSSARVLSAVVPDAPSDSDSQEAMTGPATDVALTSAVQAALPRAPVERSVQKSRAADRPADLLADSGKDPFSALVAGSQRTAQPAPLQSDAWNHFGDKQLAANSVATTVGFAPRMMATTASEPLAQMADPLDERRAMLLGGSLPGTDNGGSDSMLSPGDERSSTHISAERLYESVRRYGLGGNRISVRF
jgi:hypothetical protein